ncbi:sugar phosphate nucleotidyltransferase, partial [Klebsiella pneumoniae]
YWNSGMFLFKAKRYLHELSLSRSDILESCQNAITAIKHDMTQDFIRIDEDIFSNCPDESIDYAVMEKTKDAVVIPLNAGWNDLGSWSALWEVNKQDDNGNVLVGDVFSHNSSNCYINT